MAELGTAQPQLVFITSRTFYFRLNSDHRIKVCECQCEKIIQSGMHLSCPGIKMQLLTGQFTFGCIRRFPVYSEIYKLLYLLCQETVLSVVGFKISNHAVAKLSSSWQVYMSSGRFTIPLRNKGV